MFVEQTFYKNAYVINLRRRVDRWGVTRKHLQTLGFRPQRFEAVDGATIPDALVGMFTTPRARKSMERGYRHEHHEISRGSIGCSLSHFALWRKLLDSDAPHMTVFEDDAECVRPGALQHLPFGSGRFQLLLLGGLYDEKPPVGTDQVSVRTVKRFLCTHAYVIWKEAAWSLLQFAFPIQKQVDFYMHALPSLQISACVPAIFLQNQTIAHTDVQIPIRDQRQTRMMMQVFAAVLAVWLLTCSLLLGVIYFNEQK